MWFNCQRKENRRPWRDPIATLLRQEITQRGFAVLRRGLDEPLVDSHVKQVSQLTEKLEDEFRHDPQALKAELKKQKAELHRSSETANRLLYSDDLQSLLEQVIEAPVVMRQPETGFFQRGTPTPTRSISRLNHVAAEYRIWCALEDIDPRSGRVFHPLQP